MSISCSCSCSCSPRDDSIAMTLSDTLGGRVCDDSALPTNFELPTNLQNMRSERFLHLFVRAVAKVHLHAEDRFYEDVRNEGETNRWPAVPISISREAGKIFVRCRFLNRLVRLSAGGGCSIVFINGVYGCWRNRRG